MPKRFSQFCAFLQVSQFFRPYKIVITRNNSGEWSAGGFATIGDMDVADEPHRMYLRVSRKPPAGQPRDDAEPQSANPRSNSLTEVLLRVFASTCLTITAQYSECEPSLAGNWPDTTTLFSGTRHS